MARVLVTGATGLVGSEVMHVLKRRGSCEVVGTSQHGSRNGVEAVPWDMSGDPAPASLRGPWDVIVNTAASTRWTAPADDAVRANVATVAALATLASDDTHVVHISTAYAVGLRGDGDSDDAHDYRNTYEWSKAQAERLAVELFPRLTRIRPPLIIGRSGDGAAARFAGMYTVLRAIATSMVPAVAARADAYFDVIPVDALASLIAEVTETGGHVGEVLTNAGGEAAPRVEHAFALIVDALNRWRAVRGLAAFDTPRLLTPESWTRFFLPFARDHLSPRQLRMLDLLRNFEPYLIIGSPLRPTHPVTAVEPAIAASVRYWADANPRIASLSPQPWKAQG
jgi:nucleoside-diphosphate-sugar epimerase